MAQNAFYWVVLTHLSENLAVPMFDANGEKIPEFAKDGTATGRFKAQFYAPETWHKYFRSRYLGWEETKLPNGQTVVELRHTPDLDSSEFSEYVTRIEAWCSEHGVHLPARPDEGIT